MRKSLILAASLGTMLLSTTAFAATMNTTGVVKSILWKHHAITLSNGHTYDLPAHFAMKSLKKGEKVTVTYWVKHKHFYATSVKAG
jgi:hypothetical protein